MHAGRSDERRRASDCAAARRRSVCATRAPRNPPRSSHGRGAIQAGPPRCRHFKLVNDTDGHAEGDRLLRRTTDELQAACRTADAAFRIGGDEFALVIAATAASSAAVAAERAAEAIAAIDPRIVASYGVATYPEDAGTQEGLLAVADRRLYAMKHARRGLAGSRG